MRKRFNVGAVCSADGTSGVYKASKNAHLKSISTHHEEFISSDFGKSFIALASKKREPSPETIVRVPIFGKLTKMPYSRVLACRFTNWSY